MGADIDGNGDLERRVVFLDTETTGLDAGTDEIVEIAIYGLDGRPVFESLVRPERNTEWPEAQRIHGISPADVVGAPTLDEIADQIRAAVEGAVVVIYNAQFDGEFLGELLEGSDGVECCMLQFAEFNREWDEYHGNWRWIKLTRAARAVRHDWSNCRAHRAAADALACRSIWLYMHDQAERIRIDALAEGEGIDRECELWVHDQWSECEKRLAADREARRREIVARLRGVVGPRLENESSYEQRLDEICHALWGDGSEHYRERERKAEDVALIIKSGAKVVRSSEDLPAGSLSTSATLRKLRSLRMSGRTIFKLQCWVLMPSELDPWRSETYYDPKEIDALPFDARTYINKADASKATGKELETATGLRRHSVSVEKLGLKPVTWYSDHFGGAHPLYDSRVV